MLPQPKLKRSQSKKLLPSLDDSMEEDINLTQEDLTEVDSSSNDDEYNPTTKYQFGSSMKNLQDYDDFDEEFRDTMNHWALEFGWSTLLAAVMEWASECSAQHATKEANRVCKTKTQQKKFDEARKATAKVLKKEQQRQKKEVAKKKPKRELAKTQGKYPQLDVEGGGPIKVPISKPVKIVDLSNKKGDLKDNALWKYNPYDLREELSDEINSHWANQGYKPVKEKKVEEDPKGPFPVSKYT